jgi:hypothetical protein
MLSHGKDEIPRWRYKSPRISVGDMRREFSSDKKSRPYYLVSLQHSLVIPFCEDVLNHYGRFLCGV